ncbi:hypothetical protein SIAM614_12898 [Stappia aggregata IAM 12614]|uniref:Uncharacterized protein n=1 Tax=Roseibium aggregatum (strain ATCC 25650 / DSM 13394 / JCM 20685 / NBRC 16684 / NCIMB 2208 / IAM 12614 / B1) TaxID=384765 RepID=A0NQ55_ROSAI|nr:hypothetical protein SIAM614_12898 [Stappia aggregata IAM 12614] [Roseibium aggregatum IAM 12614]
MLQPIAENTTRAFFGLITRIGVESARTAPVRNQEDQNFLEAQESVYLIDLCRSVDFPQK